MAAMRIAMMCALALGSMAAGPALTGEAAAKKPKADKDDPSRRVCRSIVTVGTRLSTRVCRTQQQWDDAQRKTQDGLLDHQMGPGTTRAADITRPL